MWLLLYGWLQQGCKMKLHLIKEGFKLSMSACMVTTTISFIAILIVNFYNSTIPFTIEWALISLLYGLPVWNLIVGFLTAMVIFIVLLPIALFLKRNVNKPITLSVVGCFSGLILALNGFFLPSINLNYFSIGWCIVHGGICGYYFNKGFYTS